MPIVAQIRQGVETLATQTLPGLELHLGDILMMGGGFFLFLLLFSYYYDECLCNFLDEFFLLKGFFYFSIFMFVIYIFKIDMLLWQIDSAFLPYLMELREVFGLLQLIFLAIVLVFFLLAHMYVLAGAVAIGSVLAMIVLSVFISDERMLNIMGLSVAVMILLKFEGDRLKDFPKKLLRNMRCVVYGC